MNKKILLVALVMAFFSVIALTGCGADASTGSIDEGVIQAPSVLTSGE
jgi:hypothetical protein